jgi:DNA-binding beta-propeller fold protein YncE
MASRSRFLRPHTTERDDTPSGGESARRLGHFLRVLLPLAILCCALVGFAARADAAVTSGPSYVQVSGSPFAVGASVDMIAFDAAENMLAAADYVGGNLDVLSLNPLTGTLAAVGGSPFASGHGPDSVAFSPNGELVAAANLVDDTVSVFGVSAAGALTPVAGSPVPTGNSPRAVAFSPAGNLLAVANQSDGTVSVFSVTTSGELAPVPGSPFATGSEPVALSFSPAGNLLAVANEGDGSVSVFTVDPGTGVLTPSAGSPINVGDGPAALAFNSAGSLLAVANSLSSTVSVFTTGTAASTFLQVPGSPFATGDGPLSLAFDSGGDLLATADSLDGTVALFAVSATGSLSLAQGAPFASGNGPRSVLFIPKSSLLAVANGNDGTVSVLEPMPPPTATIAVPASDHAYTLGTRVRTHFSCADSSQGPGIRSCKDSEGAKAPRGLLNTKSLGHHTYKVTAVSADGLSATTTVTYLVTPAPPISISRPRVTGAPQVGHLLRCSQGNWRGRPTSYSYQWNRGDIPLAGANGATYRVRRLDEGSQLTCSVTAHNGSVTTATSLALSTPLVASRGCPAAKGSLSASALGSLKLGDTRAQADATLHRVRHSSTEDSEKFCFSPAGITIGFPTRAIAKLLPYGSPPLNMTWALTANPHYSVSGIAPGIALKTAEHLLPGGTVEKNGGSVVYLVRTKGSTLIMLAKGQAVQQIGIADNRVTGKPGLITALLASLPR